MLFKCDYNRRKKTGNAAHKYSENTYSILENGLKLMI
jgi:hypothetical protein